MQDSVTKTIGGHEVTYVAQDCLTRVRFIGRVTIGELRDFAEEFYGQPEYDQHWDILILMGSATFDLSFFGLFQYVDRVCKDSRRVLGATALVSPSRVHYGIGRMYSSTVGDRLGHLRIERSEEPALAWLKELRGLRRKEA